jgi:hypothetical protein
VLSFIGAEVRNLSAVIWKQSLVIETVCRKRFQLIQM